MKCSSHLFLCFLYANASPTLSFFMAEILFSHVHALQEITCQSMEDAKSVHSFKWKPAISFCLSYLFTYRSKFLAVLTFHIQKGVHWVKVKISAKLQKIVTFSRTFGQKNTLFSSHNINFITKFQPLKMRTDYCHKVFINLKHLQ